MATVEREIIERLIQRIGMTPARETMLQSPLGEFLLAPEDLNDPVQEIIAANWIKAAQKSGVWEDPQDVYFDVKYPRDIILFDDVRGKIKESSGKLFYQTQADIYLDLVCGGHIQPETAFFAIDMFKELQTLDRDNIAYLFDEWPKKWVLSTEDRDRIVQGIKNDIDTVRKARTAVKDFFKEELEQITVNSIDPNVKRLQRIVDTRADFIDGFGGTVIGFLPSLIKKIPTSPVSA